MNSESSREKARARQAKRRENLKKDKESYQKYLEKDRERKATWKSSLGSTELEEHKLKERNGKGIVELKQQHLIL